MYGIHVNATDINTGEFVSEFTAEDEPSVAVTYPGIDSPERRCSKCGETESDSDFCAYGEEDAHDWVDVDHAWLNSASITTNGDQISVSISVGDPRGAFVMGVERVNYVNDSGEEVTEVRLSVPAVSDAYSHMGLVPLGSHGYYRIVPSESPEHVAARNAARKTEGRRYV